MADYTPNKKLELPKSVEKYDVGVANKNNMVIDSELNKLDLKNQSQDELLATKESLNYEISRAKSSENELSSNIENETNRAEKVERDIINELVNYLPIDGTAKNSEKLGGYGIAKTGDKLVYGTIPVVDESGVIEIGKYIDFHKNADDYSDYYIRVTAKDDGLYIEDKKILVDGEVLLLTGGTLEANTNPILKLKRIEGNFAGLDFENPNGHLFSIEGYSSDDGTDKQLNVFARDWNKSLLRINESSRVVYDYITKSEKKILVEGEALPSSGGTIASATQQMLNLRYTGEKGDAIISMFPNNFTNKCVTVQSAFSTLTNSIKFKIFQIMDGVVKQLFEVSDKSKDIFDPKTNTMKPIMVKGDSITPTVKETILKTSTKELTVYGVNRSTLTDITDIFNKANTMNEGMRLGISPANGTGYIQSQNFRLDCSLLTAEERTLLQSFENIRIFKENNSDDFPRLKPDIFNYCANMVVNGKNGKITYPTKVQIQSTDSYNYFQYELPMDFRNDDFSKNILTLETKEWLVATGIDIKNRG